VSGNGVRQLRHTAAGGGVSVPQCGQTMLDWGRERPVIMPPKSHTG
jgi:hypothetical protein